MTRLLLKPVMGIAIFLVTGMLMLSSCSEIGKQDPQLWSARFTADGSRLVYTYDVVTIWQYSKQGGTIRKAGTRKAYMDVRDAVTGEALLAVPYRSKNTMNVVGLVGDRCALNTHNFEKSRDELYIMDITTGQERFGPDELSELNGGLQFDPTTHYANTTGRPGFIFAAQDARAYLIDPGTGKAELVDGDTQIYPVLGITNPARVGSRKEGMEFTGGPRQKLQVNGRYSKMDFIEPALAAGVQEDKSERVPLTYHGNPIIIAHSTTNNDFSWEITMLDAATLDPVWSASLVNVPHAAPFYWDEPLFQLNGEALLVETATELHRFDAATGVLQWTVQVP